FESYTTDAKRDLSRQLGRVRDSRPQVLFLPNYADEIPSQVQQAQQLGIDATLLGSDSWGALTDPDPAKLDGAFYSGHWAPDIAGDQAQAFIAAYRQSYGGVPGEVAALTYDAFGLLFQAMQSQGKTDPESIREALAGTKHFTGVTGSMEYKGTGDPSR